MSFLSRRVRFLAFGLGVTLACGVSWGATFSMKVVAINGTPLASPQSTIDAEGGDRIEAEVFLRGWNEDIAGSQLKTFQFEIDGTSSFFKPEVSNLNVALPGCFDLGTVTKCETSVDCPVGTPTCRNNICVRSCSLENFAPRCLGGAEDGLSCDVISNTDCPGGRCLTFNPTDCSDDLPVCLNKGLFCAGVDHDPEACTFADMARNDWPLGENAIAACVFTTGLNIVCGATRLGGGTLDIGQNAYVGTVTIDLTLDACGIIVPTFTSAKTLILLNDAVAFNPAVEPLTINIPTVDCGGCASIIESLPDSCTVDARIPHAMDSTNPNFWFNDDFDFELTFNVPPDAGFMESDFSIAIFPSQPILPSIDSFSVADGAGMNKVVSFSVNRPPSLAPTVFNDPPTPRWLCIQFTDPNPQCRVQQRCWGRAPGDANGNNTTAGDDLIALIAGLNSGDLPLTRCDVDRSGACRAPDLLTWIDLANGAGRFAEWLDTTIEVCPPLFP